MKLSRDISLIASGSLGVSLTNAWDCNAYAIRVGDEYWLIDAGVGRDSHLIAEQIEADGIPADRVRRLLLTHSHLDHSGGARWLRDHYNLEVFGSPLTAKAVSEGDQEAISLAYAKRAGVYPLDTTFEACPVSPLPADVEAIPTPGHSADMVTYRIGGNLFPGDTFFYGGKIVIQDIYDCDVAAYARSLRTLSKVSFEALFPGHGLWSMRDAHRHIDASMAYVDKLLLPPNL